MKLAPEVVAAAISAVVALLVAAGTAYWTSRATAKLEIGKVSLGAQQAVFHQVLTARLAAYPEVYQLLSQMFKDAESGIVDFAYVHQLRIAFDRWDSAKSYLLGPMAVNVAYEFRKTLTRALASNGKQSIKLAPILSAAERLELALRGDLGIHGLELNAPEQILQPRQPPHY